MAITPRTFLSESTLHIALWQNVVIVDIAGDMDVHRMRVIRRSLEVLSADYPDGIGVCTLLRPGTPVASPAAREESARFMRDLSDQLLMVGVVIEETGVVAQVLRTVIRGINVVTRNSKIIVFATLEDAVRGLAPCTVPSDPDADVATELAVAIARARAPWRTAPRAQAARA